MLSFKRLSTANPKEKESYLCCTDMGSAKYLKSDLIKEATANTVYVCSGTNPEYLERGSFVVAQQGYDFPEWRLRSYQTFSLSLY